MKNIKLNNMAPKTAPMTAMTLKLVGNTSIANTDS
jgi:hypothetical protein